MTLSEFLKPWKIHFAFGGGFLALILLHVVLDLVAGVSFGKATWEALSSIKPMEYLMFGLMWYGIAFSHDPDEGHSRLTLLNLNGTHD
ncbi:MAG: hypothetical protein QOE77_2717 [Blastocatellia bacterium]|nr:hypothetical protein [Blastocatellia bacterium]